MDALLKFDQVMVIVVKRLTLLRKCSKPVPKTP